MHSLMLRRRARMGFRWVSGAGDNAMAVTVIRTPGQPAGAGAGFVQFVFSRAWPGKEPRKLHAAASLGRSFPYIWQGMALGIPQFSRYVMNALKRYLNLLLCSSGLKKKNRTYEHIC